MSTTADIGPRTDLEEQWRATGRSAETAAQPHGLKPCNSLKGYGREVLVRKLDSLGSWRTTGLQRAIGVAALQASVKWAIVLANWIHHCS